MATNRNWYQTVEDRPSAAVRLYCLPCAGGGASMYHSWARHLPDWVELRAILLPGRQARRREASFEDCDTAAGAIADWLSEEDGPYAIFGHSMGGMLGYRATRALLARGARSPVLLGAACWPVQGVNPGVMPACADDDDVFAAKVARMGGTTAELLADPEFRPFVLAVLRSDFTLCHSYVLRDEPPVPVPVAVYGGKRDAVSPPESLGGWSAMAERVIGPRLFGGDHFFFQDDPGELVRTFAADLADVYAESRTRV